MEVCRIRTPNLSKSTEDKDASVTLTKSWPNALKPKGRNTDYLDYFFHQNTTFQLGHLPPVLKWKSDAQARHTWPLLLRNIFCYSSSTEEPYWGFRICLAQMPQLYPTVPAHLSALRQDLHGDHTDILAFQNSTDITTTKYRFNQHLKHQPNQNKITWASLPT